MSDQRDDDVQRYQASIEARARALVAHHPELADDVEAYVLKERDECVVLETQTQCVTLMLERAG
ncbi:hypothetical protein [Haliangium sp.]|uniref:hypothetical protein n=1 Tax=Haliangium sp. TaxID=2663208 RepID=UPI003D146C7C